MSDDPIRTALQSLRRDSLRASRRRDPALLISIGVADEPDEKDAEMEDTEEGERPGRRQDGLTNKDRSEVPGPGFADGNKYRRRS